MMLNNEPIDQFICMYDQLFNLLEEIKKLVAEGLTNEAIQKSTQLDNLMKQIAFARKGLTVPENYENKVKDLESKAVVEIKYVLDTLIQIKSDLKNNLNKVKNNIKIKNAYTAEQPATGQILYEEE